MHLRLSVLASRVVCGGIPVMSMVSVVASHGNTLRTYAADGIFLVPKVCILLHTFDEGFFSKNIHDRQKKQHTFLLNKICPHLILLLLVLFPLSDCLTQNEFFLFKIILTWWKKARRVHCELFFKIGKPVTVPTNNLIYDFLVFDISIFYSS